MKALATVALVGLTYASEDNELWRPFVKNNTVLRPITDFTRKPAVRPKPHGPINKNHTRLPHIMPAVIPKPHGPINKNHTRIPHRNATYGVHYPIHHRNTTRQPYHPIHKDNIKRRLFAADDDELFIDGDDEFFFPNNHKNGTRKPIIQPKAGPWMFKKNATTSAHIPYYKNVIIQPKAGPWMFERNAITNVHVPHHKNRTQRLPLAQLKKQIHADEDEFFLGLFKSRNRTRNTPNHKNKNATHHGTHNRTRPFFRLPHHNRTSPHKVVAYEDEEFFAAEDNALFDLEKLLADASKTVGDVKQNPKDYGALLNDAINIVKDIKRKDDFEDSHFMRPNYNTGRPTGGKMWGY